MSKQSTVKWLYDEIDELIIGYVNYEINLETLCVGMLEAKNKAIQMEKEQIIGAYNREVIDGIQDWFIGNGTHYYELHYEGKSGVGKYNNNPVTTTTTKTITTDENYSFEAGV